MTASNRILIIVTNTGEFEKVGFRTGLWLSELTHFWKFAEKAGYQMDIASPAGGYVPPDPGSLIITQLLEAVRPDGLSQMRADWRMAPLWILRFSRLSNGAQMH